MKSIISLTKPFVASSAALLSSPPFEHKTDIMLSLTNASVLIVVYAIDPFLLIIKLSEASLTFNPATLNPSLSCSHTLAFLSSFSFFNLDPFGLYVRKPIFKSMIEAESKLWAKFSFNKLMLYHYNFVSLSIHFIDSW